MTKRTVRRLLAMIAGVVLGIIAVPTVDIVLSEMIARQMAYHLAPPQYPNSDLVTSWASGGSDSRWDRRTYSTADSPTLVVQFMEQYLPSFHKREVPKLGTVYSSSMIDKSPFAQHAAEIFCQTLCDQFSALPYPSASVTIYSNSDVNGQTLIEIWLSWPAS